MRNEYYMDCDYIYFRGGIVLSSTHIVQNVSDTIISLGTESSAENVQGSIMILIQLAFSIGVFTFWGSGPATAAYSYITRCFNAVNILGF